MGILLVTFGSSDTFSPADSLSFCIYSANKVYDIKLKRCDPDDERKTHKDAKGSSYSTKEQCNVIAYIGGYVVRKICDKVC